MFSQHAHWGLSPHLPAWFCDYWDNNMVAAMCVCVCACFVHVQSETLSTQGHYRSETYTLVFTWQKPDPMNSPPNRSLRYCSCCLSRSTSPGEHSCHWVSTGWGVCVCVCVCVYVAMSSSNLILQRTRRAFVTESRAVKTSQLLRLLNRFTEITINPFYLSKLAWY